ncbi:MAG: hypothetical protein CML16_18140 [Pusillimonas sp.]|nr:hypothetical protein [Pusillimonas sp.]
MGDAKKKRKLLYYLHKIAKATIQQSNHPAHFIDKNTFTTQHFPIINIFIPLPIKFVANADSRNGLHLYCFIFEKLK